MLYPSSQASCKLRSAPGRYGAVVTMPHLPWAYAFALPTDGALGAIAAVSPDGVVELGAGPGFWARMLADP
jgi:hypothetical protein